MNFCVVFVVVFYVLLVLCISLIRQTYQIDLKSTQIHVLMSIVNTLIERNKNMYLIQSNLTKMFTLVFPPHQM
jgi:hypothetical protein